MQSIAHSNCFIFTALACEAKPIIQALQLKKLATPYFFDIYTHQNIVLTVAGVGKNAMAAAVAYTLVLFPNSSQTILINVGVAGHQTATLGSLFIANKITDNETEKNFYPQLSFQLACEAKPLITVSKPHTDYQEDYLYDMESSAFYEIACRFSSCELIHCFKVISDNQQHSIEAITAQQVSEWITQHVDSINNAIQHLLNLQKQLENPQSRYLAPLLTKFHFTVASEVKLKALLQRWKVLTQDAELDFNKADIDNAKTCLQYLEQQLATLHFKL